MHLLRPFVLSKPSIINSNGYEIKKYENKIKEGFQQENYKHISLNQGWTWFRKTFKNDSVILRHENQVSNIASMERQS